MKKYILAIIVLSLLIIGFLLKNKKETYFKISGYAQGTTYSVIYGTINDIDLSDSIENILKSFDQTFSSYIPNSIISRINRNDPLVTTNEMFDYVFNLSKEINEKTKGAFDITVAPLVNAWGFGWKNKITPDQKVIDSLLQIIGMEKVDLKNGRIIKQDERIQIDVNAIAQGYSVDVIADFLNNLGIKNYLIEVGGEMRGKGTKQNGNFWRIGVERPTEDNDIDNRPVQTIMELNNTSLATSGNYRKFYEKDGVKFVHTIDPATGYTVQSTLLSASVISKECARADALATGFMVLGLEKSIEIVNNMKDIEAYFIYSDSSGVFKVWATPGFDTQ